MPSPALAPLRVSHSPRVFFSERSQDHSKVSLMANFSHQVSNVCLAFLPSSLFIIYSHSPAPKNEQRHFLKGISQLQGAAFRRVMCDLRQAEEHYFPITTPQMMGSDKLHASHSTPGKGPGCQELCPFWLQPKHC